MGKKLVEVLKIFLEKYFIPTIVAIVLAFLVFFVTPERFVLLKKFGKMGFNIFSFLICFLAVLLVIFLFKKSVYMVKKIIRNIKQKKIIEEDNRIVVEQLWSAVDVLGVEDYKLLLEFLNNGNKPHISEEVFGTGLLNSDWVDKVQYSEAKQVPIDIARTQKKGSIVVAVEAFDTIAAKYQYMLKGSIYADLKASMDKYGTISHFER